MNNRQLSSLPQVETLLNDPGLVGYSELLSRPLVTDIVRAVLNQIRKEVSQDGKDVPASEDLLARIHVACHSRVKDRLQRVVNATGIIIHTNMGRSPLNAQVWEDAKQINCGYSNLELDLNDGKRGKRNGLIPSLLSSLTGAEDALVVNNNAAAVYLILSTFATGREVIVSRGEQVQIGGGFRVPEILRATGARLVEVGTTNITTRDDYAQAVTDETSMILSVHRSNFAIRGFEKSPSISDLSSLRKEDLLLCVDQGSGVINETLPGETSVKSHLAHGADLVCFSGDKIFSGPQAGIIVGRRDLIAQLEKHPLMRVFRPGKTICSLLELTLVRYLNGERGQLPLYLAQTPQQLKEKGALVIRALDSDRFSLVQSRCRTGGGTAPDESFPSLAVAVTSVQSPHSILRVLRDSTPPVIGFISDERVLLDLTTIEIEDIPHITSILRTITD